MGEHVRVLQARVQAGAVRGRRLRRERRRDDDEEEREEAATPPSTGTTQATRSRVRGGSAAPQPRRSRSGSAARGGASPPARPRTRRSCSRSAARGSCARRRRRTRSRGGGARRARTSGRDRGRREGADERVPGGDGEAAPARPRRERARDERVEGEAERDDERGAAELGPVSRALLGRVLRRALRHERVRASRRRRRSGAALDGDLAARPERSGTDARVEDRHRRLPVPSRSPS